MAEQALAYALTTKARVKDRLSITVTSFDTVLDRLINGATDWIENQCQRRFLETTYTQKVYSVPNRKQKYLMLKNFPVSALSAVQYRAGTPATPNWTDLTTDQFELLDDGAAGIVRVYGYLPYGDNAIRVTFTAGYKIAWAAAGDNSTHTLPADLSELCERMVIKAFKRREAVGKTSEGFEGSTVTWATTMDDDDKATLQDYVRLTPIF